MAAGAPHRRAPFPVPPGAEARVSAGGALWLRRFGAEGEDLAIDLSGQPTPSLVTAVLAACTGCDDAPAPPAAFFWGLEVGTRVEALLRLLALDGIEELAATAACAAVGCGEPIEIALQVDELLALQAARPQGPI
ncbi:MAG: hypothetical protein IRY94_18300, partial [Rhodospirillaceae bacterium]|nr:hypothetical protein [Rhodospirillaceae bacterium]